MPTTAAGMTHLQSKTTERTAGDHPLNVLSVKPGHDGAIAFLRGDDLIFSIEEEKDSNPRYSNVSTSTILDAVEMAPDFPDVLAVGGWFKNLPGFKSTLRSGHYFGITPAPFQESRFLGRTITLLDSTHERSHLYMAAAMAPFGPVDEAVILVWEGELGAFYHWRNHGEDITKVEVMIQPGAKYNALFALADSRCPDTGFISFAGAGKLMALVAYADELPLDQEAQATVDHLLARKTGLYPFQKGDYRSSPLYNCNHEDPVFHRAARYITDRIFETFFEAAKTSMPRDLPLLISGGCGLNCEWNRRWKDSGLFTDVFVPPCTNDSGSAIGTGAEAVARLSGPFKLKWSIDAGPAFVHDAQYDGPDWQPRALDHRALAARLAAGAVVAWVDGRCEIGPRALGHRSLLASPLLAENKDRLNAIKQRERYRPIAPCCLEEDLPRWFGSSYADRYMLYFDYLSTDLLPAVTHVDHTARVQSVPPEHNRLDSLLRAFRDKTGVGVLCNTSLNFSGFGFINRMSDLLGYCATNGVDEIVVDDLWLTSTRKPEN